MHLFRLIPILVNGMKYSEIDIILLKVRYELHQSDHIVTVVGFYTRTNVNTEVCFFGFIFLHQTAAHNQTTEPSRMLKLLSTS